MRNITGFGETVFDIVFKNGQPQAAVPGGSTFNSIISLGRTAARDFSGTNVRMLACTGDDHIGDIVSSFMADNGVSTEALMRQPSTQTTVSLAFLDSSNDAVYEFYKDSSTAVADAVPELSFSREDILLFGSFFAVDPVSRHIAVEMLRRAKEAGSFIYYDINYRRNHIRRLQELLVNIEDNCRASSVVRGSIEDFECVFGISDPCEVYERYMKFLCPVLICTCGSEPTHLFTGKEHFIYPVDIVETVSTIGAGDNFNAGFIYGLIASGIDKTRLCSLNKDDWDKLISTASSFSSATCRSMWNYVDKDFRP